VKYMHPKLNIFVVHPSSMLTDYLPNGAGWINYNYLKGLTERGHTLHVAVPCLKLQAALPPGLHTHLVPQRSGMMGRLAYMGAVRKLFRRLSHDVQFDIVQQFTPVDTGLSLGLLGSSVPVVLGPYSGHWPASASAAGSGGLLPAWLSRKLRDVLAWLQQRSASALVITCPAAAARLVGRKSTDPIVHIVSHGIDSKTYVPREAPPSKPSILFLALLEHRKGIFTLLDAFDIVAQRIAACELEIWGNGAEAAAVEARIAQSPWRSRIHLRGVAPRDQVSRIMRAHSVYCMPSFGEPFGMTLLEAMASGVPIVTTDSGGPPFIVQPRGGRTVPADHPALLAAALMEILGDAPLQVSMGSYNRSRAEQQFDWGRSLDRMEEVYASVLADRAPRPLQSL
jgi:L-malate glycosyltransferase